MDYSDQASVTMDKRKATKGSFIFSKTASTFTSPEIQVLGQP